MLAFFCALAFNMMLTCRACVAGQEPNADNTACVECTVATYSPSGDECMTCDAPSVVIVSKFQNRIGCGLCASGEGPSDDGASCTPCTGTTYSTTGRCQECVAPNTVDDTHQACASVGIFSCPGGTSCESYRGCQRTEDCHVYTEVDGHITFAIPLHEVNADRAGFESSFADALVTQFAASEGVVIDHSNIMVRSIEVACDYSGQCQRATVNYIVIVLSPCINDTTYPGGHCGTAKKAAMGAANAQVLSAAAVGTFKAVDIPGAEISSVDPNPPIPPPAAGDAALTTPLVMLLYMAVLLQL